MMAFIGGELRRFVNTCHWSLDGWCAAWTTEKSLRQWTAVNALSAALAFTLDLTTRRPRRPRIAAAPRWR